MSERDEVAPAPKEPPPLACAREGEAGIEGFPGPFAVGAYARVLQRELRRRARVCLIGEVAGVSAGRGANVYFELRDSDGAVPCAMWRNEFDRCGLPHDALADGARVVVAGGPDYYPGGATASPSFSFRVSDLRLAGEGDLLARLAVLRRQLAAEGLFERQKALPRSALPRTIGVVTGEGGAARRDLVAALERRGWRGRIVWAFAPVQDRRAAPRIAAALRDLAGTGMVEAIVVTRGGGSLADLWAFCDEALCRTVALLGVPVVSAVGHETDRTLIDDVAALACSTPTHAAEAVVAVDCRAARLGLERSAVALQACSRAALADRARRLRPLARAPREHVLRHRRELEQQARELRAAARRGIAERVARQRLLGGVVLPRKRSATLAGLGGSRAFLSARARGLDRGARAEHERRRQALAARAETLAGHDPERTLERGYALVLDAAGEPLPRVAAARAAGEFDLRFMDGTVPARVREDGADDGR